MPDKADALALALEPDGNLCGCGPSSEMPEGSNGINGSRCAEIADGALKLIRKVQSLHDRRLANALSAPNWEIMLMLLASPGGLAYSAVANRIVASASVLARWIAVLEEQGWIEPIDLPGERMIRASVKVIDALGIGEVGLAKNTA